MTTDLANHYGIVVPAGCTVKAVAFAFGFNNSAVSSLVVKNGTLATPTFIDYGAYSNDISKHVIAISC